MQSRSEGALPPTGVLGGDDSEREAGHRGSPGFGKCTTEGRGRRGGARSAQTGAPLPCQNSNNSNDAGVPDDRRVFDVQLAEGARADELFPPGSRRTAFALQLNVQAMCEQFGIENVGFLTLTFAQHITDPKVAQKRMNSLTTGVLRPRYGNCIRVIERQKSGRIHYHLLVNVGADIRTGADFNEFARGIYKSASPRLRCEWAFWRKTAKLYGFGRTELMPVKSTTEAIGRYVGKYIAKHLNLRQMRDKGVRLVSYTGGKTASTRFAWASKGSRSWRRKLAAFVQMLHQTGSISSPTTESMARVFGPRWVWKWRDSIMTFPIEEAMDDGEQEVLGDDSGAKTAAARTCEQMGSKEPGEEKGDESRVPREERPEASPGCASEVPQVGGPRRRGVHQSGGRWCPACDAAALALGPTWICGIDGVVDLSTGEVRLCGMV